MDPLAEALSNILDLPPFSWYVNRQQKKWDQEQARRSKLWKIQFVKPTQEKTP